MGKWQKRIKTNDRHRERNFDNRETDLLIVVVKVPENLGELMKLPDPPKLASVALEVGFLSPQKNNLSCFQ